jgi:hypothetical protein
MAGPRSESRAQCIPSFRILRKGSSLSDNEEKRMEISDTVGVHWVLRASEAEIETDALEKAGGKLDEPPRPYEPGDEERDKYAHAAFEPLTLLVAAYTTAFLAERLSRLTKDQRHAGLVFDLGATPAKIWEEPALDRGAVYVISTDGIQQLSQPETVDIIAAMKASSG